MAFPNFLSFSSFIEREKSSRIKLVNNYILLEKLSGGKSSAEVYLAKHKITKRLYAIKAYQLDKKLKNNSAFRELRILKKIHHQNVISFKEAFVSKDRVYLVLDVALYGSLERILKIEKKLSENNAALIFKQVALGLQEVHRNRFVHHDLKPANILVTKNKKIKISDFGVGRSYDSFCSLFGTPAYQAPEIINSDNMDEDLLSEDIWSFGVSLFETVFGYLPFQGDDVYEIQSSIHNKPLSIPENCSSDLRDVLMKCLSIDLSKRISVTELVAHPFFGRHGQFRFSSSISLIEVPKVDEMKEIKEISVSELLDENVLHKLAYIPQSTNLFETCFHSFNF